jgi:urea transport system substrate-binding protein
MPTDDKVYSFGPFTLDVTARALSVRGEPLVIGSRSFEILAALIERRGEVVSKQDLLARAWPNLHVEEHNLKVHVSALRRALGEEARQLLINVPGRGYSFVGEVALSDKSARAAGAGPINGPDAISILSGTKERGPQRDNAALDASTVKIGIVHSLTGPMAQSEGPISDATLLAVHEINQAGGVLGGRLIEPLVVDCESDEDCFAARSQELVSTQKVSALFGCLTSASRKQVKAVVEQHDHLLLYPMQYEGLEQSPNIFYLGAAPNQQLLPAVRWTFAFLRRRRFFLVGWDSIYSRASNAILRDEIQALGGTVVGEEYIHVAGVEIRTVVEQIAEAGADIILNSIVGDVNAYFCRVLRGKGIRAPAVPMVYFSISENELRGIPRSDAAGDYGVFSYFQSLERPENRAFVTSFRSRYGSQRVTSDPMEAAYAGVYLWTQAVNSVGKSDDIPALRTALRGQTLNAPSGVVTIDRENQHTWKTVRIAEITRHGEFSIIWSSEKPIQPEPYPVSRSVNEWHAFLESTSAGWRGHWSRPSPV